MEVVKKILQILLQIICYIFKGLWIILFFIGKCIWKGIVWVWEYIILVWKTPMTASGHLDRRFKSTRTVEKKYRSFLLLVVLITFVLPIIVGAIVTILEPDKSQNKQVEDSSFIIKKDKVKSSVKKKTVKTGKEENKMNVMNGSIIQEDTIVFPSGQTIEDDKIIESKGSINEDDNTEEDFLEL